MLRSLRRTARVFRAGLRGGSHGRRGRTDVSGPDGTVEAGVTVENVGERAGHEVAQWYTRDVHPPLARPVRKLRGFERVYLEPGEAARVTLELGATQLAFLDRREELAAHSGEYELEIGRSSDDLRGSERFAIRGEKRRLALGERRLFSDVRSERIAGQ